MGLFDKFTKSDNIQINDTTKDTSRVLDIQFNGFSKTNRDIA